MNWTLTDLKAITDRISVKGRTVHLLDQAVHEPKPAKYKAVPTMADGIKFDSGLEAKVYRDLKLREKAGEIYGLRRQVKFSLFAGGGEHIGTYTADFVFDEKGPDGTFKRVVADAKSPHTRTLAAWRRTRKLMLACHGIDVRELP